LNLKEIDKLLIGAQSSAYSDSSNSSPM
jgi:hypothetical protein